MARRLKRVVQPPIDRLGRPSESRPARAGLMLVAAGALVLLAGLSKTHPVVLDGRGRCPEYVLVQAVTSHAVASGGEATPGPGGKRPSTQPPKAGGLKIDVEKTDDYCPT